MLVSLFLLSPLAATAQFATESEPLPSYSANYGSWATKDGYGGLLGVQTSLAREVDLSLQLRSGDRGPVAAAALIGHTSARSEWITMARIGILVQTNGSEPFRLTAESGVLLRVNDWLAAGFIAFADASLKNVTIGKRWTLALGRW